MVQMFGVLNAGFVGMCVPEQCTENDIEKLFDNIIGSKQWSQIVIVDEYQYSKNNLQWTFGTAVWFIIFGVAGIVAIYATYTNQKAVKAIKDKKDEEAELGRRKTANQLRKSQGPEEKGAKTKPSFWVQWDLVVNLRGLIYPMRINSSVQVFELMRIAAFFWVVWGHEFAYRMPDSSNYIASDFFHYTGHSWGFTLIETGFYAVDIFLFIGGYVSILATTKYVNSFQRATIDKWPAMYGFCLIKRYVRIMPAYAMMMLYYWKVNPVLARGGPFSSESFQCNSSNFWNSFIIPLRASITKPVICAGWCWYLAVDF
jgi:hypothetical protein